MRLRLNSGDKNDDQNQSWQPKWFSYNANAKMSVSFWHGFLDVSTVVDLNNTHVAEQYANHYNDVIMTTMASQITSLTVVYLTVYSDTDQRKHQSSASLAFVWGIHRDRWIPRTKGQLRGKCFHLMTSSCMPYVQQLRSFHAGPGQDSQYHSCWCPDSL